MPGASPMHPRHARKQLVDKPTDPHPRRHPTTAKQKGNRAMTLNLQGGERVGRRIAALPARYPYVGEAEKNVYLFAPTEAERDLIVQALCAFTAASPPNGSA